MSPARLRLLLSSIALALFVLARALWPDEPRREAAEAPAPADVEAGRQPPNSTETPAMKTGPE